MTEATLHTMFEKDLAEMRSGDIDAMLANYHPDAQIMRLPDTVATGPAEVRAFLEGYLALHPEIIEVVSVNEAADTVVYHSKIRIGGQAMNIVGTWVLRDGLIWRQTAVIIPVSTN